jgi:hypothetical protein
VRDPHCVSRGLFAGRLVDGDRVIPVLPAPLALLVGARGFPVPGRRGERPAWSEAEAGRALMRS